MSKKIADKCVDLISHRIEGYDFVDWVIDELSALEARVREEEREKMLNLIGSDEDIKTVHVFFDGSEGAAYDYAGGMINGRKELRSKIGQNKLSNWMFDSIKKAIDDEGKTINTRLNNVRWVLQQKSIPVGTTEV